MSADALHAQRCHARFLVEDKKAHYALCVKKNQAGLYERLHMLPWKQVTAKFYDRTEGHGRKETRIGQVLTSMTSASRMPRRSPGSYVTAPA